MDFSHLFSGPQAILDLIILIFGFFLGVSSRSRWFVIFLQVSLLMAKMAKWYFETHPNARKGKKYVKIDEKIDEIYHKHLKQHDPDNLDDLIGYEITEVKKD